MWEQIRSNKRKSMVLVAAMALLLFILGYIVAEALVPGAGLFGLVIAMAIWVILSLAAYFKGDSILLAVGRAKKIEKADAPQLYNVVEEMTIAAGLPKPPDIYIVNDMSMNAFAVGRSPDKAAVAVTAGLLAKLNRDELQGVIAHEMSHVLNRDVLLMTMVGIMLGSIVMIAHVFLRGMLYGAVGRSSRRYSGGSKGGGQGQAIMMVVAVVFAILAPILAQLIYFAVSRRREYLADANAALLTRYPDGLASALEKLGAGSAALESANKATAPMYIINPFAKASLDKATSTHPPLAERVRILRGIAGTVSLGAYQKAWGTVAGKKSGHLPPAALREGKAEPIRKAHKDAAKKKDPRQQLREAGDLLRKSNGFLFLPCVCGLRLKLPPDFKKDKMDCPRCHRELAVPVAQLAAMGQIAKVMTDKLPGQGEPAGAAAKPAPDAPLSIKREGDGWMSFKCTCGATKTLSPDFAATKTQCDSCKKTIQIS